MAKTVFFISPVAAVMDNQNPELEMKLFRYVLSLEKRGYVVYWPLRDTNQVDITGGLTICRRNFKSIIDADEIHIWYDETSGGSKFDMGGVFMLCEILGVKKRIVIANEKEVQDDCPKSFFKIFQALAQKAAR